MKASKFVVTTLVSAACLTANAKSYTLSSPDGRLSINIDADKELVWSITQDETCITLPSRISMEGIKRDKPFAYGKDIKVLGTSKDKNDGYSQITLKCAGNYNVEFRAYNNGAAYRFVNIDKTPLTVNNEVSEYNFNADYNTFTPYVNDNRGGERYCYSFESYYDKQKLSELYADSLIITPMAICLPEGRKAVIFEANLSGYPGMFLKKDYQGVTSEFAPYPLEEIVGGFNRLNIMPTKRADHIAEVTGRKFFPWRVVAVSREDKELLTCNLSEELGPKCRIKDTSWIKPGKVAWDWWNNCNITGVDFKSGMNTPTYKYYIDFAQKNKLEYIIIDEGWSNPEDLYDLNKDINLTELLPYAEKRGVGIILWSSWRNLTQHGKEKMNEIMEKYSGMGIKGFKVDFFDRDDQKAIQSAWDVAECAARHHLLLDYHGLKPFGIQYAYPNILNFEGVKGLENSKWEPRNSNGPIHDQPAYDCEIPFLRMLPGPLDYTPGAMMNATKDMFFGNNDHPMSQGTRVHQMAMYTIFYAPLQMLADSPTKYIQNQECTDFLANVPTTWDETIAIDGKIGEYVVMARRNGNRWFVAGLNNWTARDINIDLGMLKYSGNSMTLFTDGVNAHKEATDYKKNVSTARTTLNIHMAPGGGFTAIIE